MSRSQEGGGQPQERPGWRRRLGSLSYGVGKTLFGEKVSPQYRETLRSGRRHDALKERADKMLAKKYREFLNVEFEGDVPPWGSQELLQKIRKHINHVSSAVDDAVVGAVPSEGRIPGMGRQEGLLKHAIVHQRRLVMLEECEAAARSALDDGEKNQNSTNQHRQALSRQTRRQADGGRSAERQRPTSATAPESTQKTGEELLRDDSALESAIENNDEIHEHLREVEKFARKSGGPFELGGQQRARKFADAIRQFARKCEEIVGGTSPKYGVESLRHLDPVITRLLLSAVIDGKYQALSRSHKQHLTEDKKDEFIKSLQISAEKLLESRSLPRHGTMSVYDYIMETLPHLVTKKRWRGFNDAERELQKHHSFRGSVPHPLRDSYAGFTTVIESLGD